MKSKQMKIFALVAAMFGMTSFWGQGAYAADSMPGMDHSGMDMGQMAPATTDAMGGMDHSKMKSGAEAPAGGMQNRDQAAGGGKKTTSMQSGAAPADARDPHAYSDSYDFGPIPPPVMADQAYMGGLMANRLERSRSADNSFNAYDIQGWFGKDYERLVLKAEGAAAGGKLQEARTELLWGHALATYWNTQLGVRYDSGLEPDQTWLAFGVQGIAPYWFEVDASAYAGDNGKTALRLGAEYELLLTQKLILQPRVEASIYGQTDPVRELGSGLSSLVAGVRLRYEIRREFAPYVGVEWNGKFSGTADFARAANMPTKETYVVAGLRFWF